MTKSQRLLVLMLLGWLVGCAAAEPGWQRLWENDWTRHGDGSTWVLGVEADGREVDAGARGVELRVTLTNLGPEPAEVRLDGPGEPLAWKLGPGEQRPVREVLRNGVHRFASSPGVVLAGPRLGRALENPRLVVVILVDTLRDDHVNADLMPGVTRFFADGRRWTDAVANAPWTLPSVASFFAAEPVLELTSPGGEIVGLPKGTATWGTRLHEAGFEGGAAVANITVHAHNGYAGGFSEYLLPESLDIGEAPDGAWVVAEGRRWLAEHEGEDAFLYLHLMDPHAPYRKHTDPDFVPPDLNPLIDRSREPTPDEAILLPELYAGEVRHVDELLTPFLDELPDSAVVVLTADHGEGLGEHGAWGHGLNLYREALRVPLLLRAPSLPSGGTVDGPVQLVDVGPTVLDLAGVPADEHATGRSLLRGGSPGPVVSATFGSGPLRWAWRQGSDKVVLRTAPQAGLGAESRTRFGEKKPFPSGIFHFDLARDPAEDDPGALPDRISAEAGAAFADTAGRLVPGLQLMLWDGSGPAEAALELGGEVEVVQAWSTSPVSVSRIEGRFELRCDDAAALCAVSLEPESVGETVSIAGALPGWRDVAPGAVVDPRTVPLPAELGGGFQLWWNPPRSIVVGGYEETLQRLKALGYVD
ncbi:MAG: sulfatase [Thermoanaerobaculales bacterium]|jgi:arylsulfatase A-like enzyme|nr:sulfatase [Thermoanaerobaculales bacterium]